MANFSGIARPYALAAFEYAREKQQLSAWKTFLASAAIIANDSAVKKLIANPNCIADKLFSLFQSILATTLDPAQENFLALLSQNKRLYALPAIAESFSAHYAALEKISDVRVVTAIEANDEFKQKLAEALSKRIQRQVTLHCEVDPSLLGGAIVYIGDRIIDGSVRSKLTRLLQDLTG